MFIKQIDHIEKSIVLTGRVLSPNKWDIVECTFLLR